MNIVIVGAGRVGIHLAKYFANERQDVFLIDNDSAHLQVLESDYNMRTFLGEPTDFGTLRKAFVEHADIFVAVTADTATNLVVCAMAKSMGAKRTIARVDKYDFLEEANSSVVRNMGVDHVVYPDLLAARQVIAALDHSWCFGWNDFSDGAIVMVAVRVDEQSPVVGALLKEICRENRKMHISALKRDSKTLIPHGDDTIQSNDILYITTVPEGMEQVKAITGRRECVIKNVIVMGGSAVAELTAKLADKRYSFVIVDKNLERCRQLSGACDRAEVIYGDGSDQDVLDEAGLAHGDAFVALSDSSEGNILSCLAAQDGGVVKTVAEVEKEQFIAKAEAFHIGAIINKPIITANAIFQLILDSSRYTSKCFAMKDAEVARMDIDGPSWLTQCRVKDMKLPAELTFAGLIRDGKGEIITGNTRLQPGDSVIVFCLNGSLNKVEKLFRK